MKDFLLEIQGKLFTRSFASTWANGAKGAIILNEDGLVTFEEYTQDLTSSAVDDEGKPLEHVRLNNAKFGFITWLLYSIQHDNVEYDKFYTDCRDYYVSLTKNSPVFWKWQNNIDEHFLEVHYKAMKEQLTDIPLYEYLYDNDVKQIKEYCSNYLEWLESKMPKPVKEKPLKNDKKELPSKLNTSEAKRIFKELEVLKCYEQDGNLYKWIDSGASFGAFVDLLSEYLYVRPSNNRLPWKLFKVAFNVDESKLKAAKKAVDNYKNNRGNEPDIYQDIKHLLKK